MGSEKWDAAGFTDLQGLLGKRIGSGKTPVYRDVGLDAAQEYLVWKQGQVPRWVNPSGAAFEEFVRLWERPAADRIVKYAKKFGLLRLNYAWLRDEARWGNPGYGEMEPISTWLHFSRRASAVLSIASSLSEGKPAPTEHWQVLIPITSHVRDEEVRYLDDANPFIGAWARTGHSPNSGLWTCDARKAGQLELWHELLMWMKLGRVGLTLQYAPGKSPLAIDYGYRLFGAIALQLVLTIAGADCLYTCSGCGKPYIRDRSPKRGGANFCPQCGRGEALKQADRRRREKMIEARRLFAEGKLPAEISRLLKVRKVSTVRGWLAKGK